MKMKKLGLNCLKLALSLNFLALVGCSTIELAHEPLNCIDKQLAPLSSRLTDEQLNSINDDVFDALEIHILTYQQRIKSQCELIKRHNAGYTKD